MKKLLIQIAKFLAVSGTGWVIDFGVFLMLTSFLQFNVAYANMISCIPSLTFVFLVSTHKVFARSRTNVPLYAKYIIYFAYQMVMVFCVSWLGQWLYDAVAATQLMNIALIAANLKLLCKICITPITMTINFCVMKVLSEKL